MKKQLLLPVLLAVFAVGSAFASIKFAPGYYSTSDSTCSGTAIPRPCEAGDDSLCVDINDNPFYTKANSSAVTSPQNPCEELLKEGF
jgi:hypothetical protein